MLKRPDILPAPWTWADQDTFSSELITQDGEDSVLFHSANWPMAESDKQLLAALPDLLTQLENTLADLEDFTNPHGEFEWSDEAGKKIVADLKATLLKAGYAEEEPAPHPEELTVTAPSYWCSYLVNGDDSSLTPEEKEQADYFLSHFCKGLCIVSCSDEEFFRSSNDATDLAGNVLDYYCIKIETPSNELRPTS